MITSNEEALRKLVRFEVIDGKIEDEFNFKIKPFPNDSIDDEALKVNRIEKIALYLEPYKEPKVIYNEFTAILKKYIDKFEKTDKFYFIAYNASFDMDMLRTFFDKNGDKYFGSWFFFPYIDVMTIAAAALVRNRHTMTDFKLGTVAKELGLSVDESKQHDAMYDIKLTRDIMGVLRVRRKE